LAKKDTVSNQSVSNAIKFKVGGRARTKKVQGSLLGSLAYLYKLDEKLVRQLSDKLGVPLTYNKFTLHQMYGTLQKEYRRAHDEIKETLKSDDTFSVDNVEAVLDQLKSNQFGFSLYKELLAKEDDAEELLSESLLAKMKERFDMLSANGSANIESSNNLSRLQSLYRGALTENERKGGDPFSSEYFSVVEERLKMNPESATLLQDQLAKVGGVDELLTKMKEKYDSIRENFDFDLSTLQNVYRNALTEEERKGGDPFSSEYFKVIEERLKEDPESATLLQEQLAKVGGNQEELLAKMKERFDTLSTFGGNQYISHTSEGDVVNQILLYRFEGDLVLTTTKTTNLGVKGKTWDGFKRLVETPNPLNTSQTMGDLLGLKNVTEKGLNMQILCRAGLKLNDSGKPHLLADKPFHLLIVTVSEPGKYLVKDLGFKEGALQVWADAVQVRNNNQSDSIFDLYAEPASFDMDADELREKYIGKIADGWNKGGNAKGTYSTAQKVLLLGTLNVLTNRVRDYMILTKGDKDGDYLRPSLGQAADVLSDALSEDTTLPFPCITSVAVGVGSLPKVVTEGMKWKDKVKFQVKISTSGPEFVIAIAPKSSHPLAKMMINAICIVLNKTVGFDKMKRKVKQDTLVEICK